MAALEGQPGRSKSGAPPRAPLLTRPQATAELQGPQARLGALAADIVARKLAVSTDWTGEEFATPA